MEYVLAVNYGDSQMASAVVDHVEFNLHAEIENNTCYARLTDMNSELFTICSSWIMNHDYPTINELILTRKDDGAEVYRSNYWKYVFEARTSFREDGLMCTMVFANKAPHFPVEEEE